MEKEFEKYQSINNNRKMTLLNICATTFLRTRRDYTQEELKGKVEGIKLMLACGKDSMGKTPSEIQEEKDFVDIICQKIIEKRSKLESFNHIQIEGIIEQIIQETGITRQKENQNKEGKGHKENKVGKEVTANKGETEKIATNKPRNLDNLVVNLAKQNVDFSSLYQPELLKSNPVESSNDKKLKYQKNPAGSTISHTFSYGDEKVTIKRIGELQYTNFLNTQSYLHEYFVIRQDGNGKTIEAENVFTDISIAKMEDDEEYKQIVLGELLSSTNLHLRNSHHYVGEVTEAEGTNQNSPKYEIVYLPESYTAVVENEKQIAVKRQARREEQAK